ncbi:hypothetical protein GQ54DRAFT_309238 [Martensiomyces pterosporus]|nr:hypothetical protein GQ54DRAFT_309238 [Martensiomyces pterosporus]
MQDAHVPYDEHHMASYLFEQITHGLAVQIAGTVKAGAIKRDVVNSEYPQLALSHNG